jgi:ABC-type bacteriocin/lantibiotic exporter with double-glycine peptidase domain
MMRLHERHLTIDEVKRVIPFDPDRGCSLADLERGAEALEFPVETRFVNPRDLDKLPFPFIVYTEGSLERQIGHFDVIIAYHPEERKYSIIDSTFGTVHKVGQEAILKNYTGYVLLTRRPLESQTSHVLGLFFISLACVSSGIAIFLFRKKKVTANGITMAGPETASITLSP